MKSSQGEKDQNKSLRQARTLKNIDDLNDDSKKCNKVFAQTSPFKFNSDSNKNYVLHNYKSYEISPIKVKITQPATQLHHHNMKNK